MANAKLTLSDSFILRGKWWLPETPNNKITGELSFYPSGPSKLSLQGLLRNLRLGDFEMQSPPVIEGKTPDGRNCTLLNTFETSLQLAMHGGGTSEYCFNRLVIGKQVVTEDTKFESAVIYLANFENWLQRNPFTDNLQQGICSSISHNMPSKLYFRIPELDASFWFESILNIKMESQTRRLNHSDYLRIKPKRKMNMDWYQRVAFKFRMFLSLLVGEVVSIKSISLCIKDPHITHNYLDLYFHQEHAEASEKFYHHQMIFPYPLIKKDLRQALRHWFSITNRLDTLCGLYFGLKLNRKIPQDFQLLTLIQAIESYHRTSGNDKYVAEDQYRTIKEALNRAIPNSTNADLRAALKARINFGNEYSLRKRLTLIFSSVPQTIVNIITDDASLFIKRVVDTRNYLTHRDEAQATNIMDFTEMYNACESLSLLVSYLLYKESGIPSNIIERVLTQPRFAHRFRLQ